MRSMRGSFSLEVLFATTFGFTLALGAANLVRYVTASGAVESAARAVSRCIVPTDGACLRVEGSAAGGEREWFVTGSEPILEERARRFRYTATASRQQWELQAQGFRVPTGTLPPVTFEGYPTEVELFEARQRRAATFARFEYLVNQYSLVPKSDPIFPRFNQSHETGTVNSSPSSWKGSGFKKSSASGLRLGPGSVRTISTGRIRVPKLPGPPDTPCQKGSSCGAAKRAGNDDAKPQDWRKNAYLAVKVFAHAKSVGPQRGRVAWASGENAPGLKVDIWGPNGKDHRSVCLGGRSPSGPLSEGGEWYNLWLRGPNGSNGGSNAVCPGGKIKHDNIAVPRGGSFKVTAFLRALDGDVVADASIHYYFDDYKLKRSVARFACPDQEITPENPRPTCPSAEACEVPRKVRAADRKCASLTPKESTSCTQSQPDTSLFFATYSRETPPPVDDTAYCPWESSGRRVLFTAAPLKPDSLPRRESLLCGEDVTPIPCDDALPDVTHCNGLTRFTQEQEHLQRSLRQASIVPLPLSSFAWDGSWRNRADAFTFSPPPSQERCKVPLALSATLPEPALVRSDPKWRPSLADFVLPVTVLESSPAEDQLRLTRVGTATPVPIRGVYPFQDEPVFELPTSASPVAVSADCPNVPLEEQLRGFAAAALPSLRDPSVALETTAEFIDEQVLGRDETCGDASSTTTKVSPCTPVQSVPVGTRDCTKPRSLGVYPASLYPEGPSLCRSRTCFSRPVDGEEREGLPVASIDTAQAQATGFKTFAKVFPQALLGCSEASCLTVNTDLQTSGEAEIRLVYKMPLTFPFDLLLGDTLPVEHKIQEPLELSHYASRVTYAVD